MNRRTGTYPAYSVGVGITWAVLLVLARLFAPAGRRRTIFLVFGGFAIGWTSATIARYVYPPPRKYQHDASEMS
jgi:hypothetical protein